jgi:hypothetical protein
MEFINKEEKEHGGFGVVHSKVHKRAMRRNSSFIADFVNNGHNNIEQDLLTSSMASGLLNTNNVSKQSQLD